MVEILDWLELVWRGLRRWLGVRSSAAESYSSVGEIIAALVVVVLSLYIRDCGIGCHSCEVTAKVPGR